MIRTIVLVLGASLPLLGSAVPAGGSLPIPGTAAPWLIAQVDRRMPTCEFDGRQVPVGTSVCRNGSTWTCEQRGWRDTRKPC